MIISTREIKPGEEILVNYIPVALQIVPGHPYNPEKRREVLKMLYRIVCPENCLCRVPEYAFLHKQLMILNYEINKEQSSDHNLGHVKMILEGLPLVTSYPGQMAAILSYGSVSAIERKKTMGLAKYLAKKAYELTAAASHPDAPIVDKFKKLWEDPSTHTNYLKFD